MKVPRRNTFRPATFKDQSGINMVDLMMWLVIAALLLAAAIQSIGYYQKAALLYQLSSDASSAGQNIWNAAALNNGAVTDAVVTSGLAATAKSNPQTKLIKQYSNGQFTVTSSHPNVSGSKVVYSSADQDGLKPGVNVISVAPGSPGFTSVYNTGDPIPGPAVDPNTNRYFTDSSGKCLDLWGAKTDVGTQVMIYKDCHGGANQQWKWSGDGQIKPSFATTKCIEFSSESTRRLRLADCSDTAEAQIFRTMAVDGNNFKMFHPESGKCLQDTVNTWDWVLLTDCSSSTAMRWSFTTTK